MSETTQFGGNENNTQQSAGTLKSDYLLRNRYRIVGILGGGGMGTVYQARDMTFQEVRKLVAIKEMQTVSTDTAMRLSMIKTFRREANILATLNHPAIPKIFDFFDDSDRAYLVMEYINGSDLELLMSKTRELPINKVVEWSIDLCDVLEYLHRQKPDPIVFRDIKPSNLMVDSLGKIRLIDFGIAKAIVGTGIKHTMIGTEGYSAPEQYRGQVTPQSDIYSLGATLHHLLTRKDPRLEPPLTFNDRPIRDFNPKVPHEFIRIIEKALALTPAERYESCAMMKLDLESLRHQLTNGGKPIELSGAPLAQGEVKPNLSGEADDTNFFGADANASQGQIQPQWTFKTEDEIRGSPSNTRDLAIVGSYDTNVWAIKLETGAQVWKFPTHGGIASSPIVDDSNRHILFGSEDQTFYAVDYRSGRVSWTHNTKGRIRGTPCLAHDHIFFGSDDGKVYALSASNGRMLWAYDMSAPVRSRPFVTNDLVIVGAESGDVVGLSLSGNRKWSYRTKKAVTASPHVNMDEAICYIASTDGFVYSLDASTGFNSWRFRTNGPIFSSVAERKGLIYFGSTDGFFYAINSQTSKEKWKFNCETPIVGSPTVHRDVVYFGDTKGILYALDAENGKERWRYQTSGGITSAPRITNNLILVGSMDGQLYALPFVE